MANLKDLIVNGASRFIGKVYSTGGFVGNLEGKSTSADSASKATGVVDYNASTNTIQIGYSGDGISGDEIKYIAGYTTGSGSGVSAKIKDISKDALKSWLNLNNVENTADSAKSVKYATNAGTATKALTIPTSEETGCNIWIE